MSERDFCYWLQGIFEVSNPKSLDEDQTKIIKDHLQLVFEKITPDYTEFLSGESVTNGTKYC